MGQNEWYQQTRPHIETVNSRHEHSFLDEGITGDNILLTDPAVKAINWSPPFQAPFLFNVGGRFSSGDPIQDPHDLNQSKAFHKYFDAIRHFKNQLEADHAVFEKKMEPGTAVIFDNRRIVHARRAFENRGGERWLRGAYVDTDVFRSRLKILQQNERSKK
ncbi:MAG: hypothetical protein Q9224_001569 [Gallowayella concinna]